MCEVQSTSVKCALPLDDPLRCTVILHCILAGLGAQWKSELAATTPFLLLTGILPPGSGSCQMHSPTSWTQLVLTTPVTMPCSPTYQIPSFDEPAVEVIRVSATLETPPSTRRPMKDISRISRLSQQHGISIAHTKSTSLDPPSRTTDAPSRFSGRVVPCSLVRFLASPP